MITDALARRVLAGINGRAKLIVKHVLKGSGVGIATSCTGFDGCASLPASLVAGPIDVDVVP
jgi:hypothetical protein